MAKDDKLKALDAAIAQIERQYGKGSVMKLGDNSANMNVETVPTGSLSLDIALGLGGLPKGRIIEIYGPESSGKTTLALHAVAEAQKLGGEAAFIETLTGATGISADEFAKERKTAAVQNLVNSWKSVYDVAKIQGIPAYVVNGKWLIMTKSIQSIDGFVALIQKLSKM